MTSLLPFSHVWPRVEDLGDPKPQLREKEGWGEAGRSVQVGAVVCDNGKWVTGQEPSSPSFSCLQNQAASLPCAAMHKKGLSEGGKWQPKATPCLARQAMHLGVELRPPQKDEHLLIICIKVRSSPERKVLTVRPTAPAPRDCRLFPRSPK